MLTVLARFQAITELLFFASVGDLNRCQRLVRHFSLDISDPRCCDYDFRTPLHLAASEGAFSAAKWFIDECKASQGHAMSKF